MFRYILALLFVTTHSSSSVIPAPNQSNGSLANLLNNLANNCGNPFLSSQIKARVDECNVVASLYNEKEFECLLFYDINSQLCVSASKLALKENFTRTMKEEIDIVKLCDNAENWTFGEISSFPGYQSTVGKVFNTKLRITCLKVCGVDDVTSQDTNFFCKYYKWGFQILKNLTTDAPTNVELSSNVIAVGDGSHVNLVQSEISTVHSQNNTLLSSSSNDVIDKEESAKEPESGKIPLEKIDDIKRPEPVNIVPAPSSTIIRQPVETDNAAKSEDGNPSGVEAKVEMSERPASASASANLDSNNEGIDKPSAADLEPVKKGDKEDKDTINKGALDVLPSDLKNPNADNNKDISDDYQDTEEGVKEGDDGEDPILGDIDSKIESTLTQTKNLKKIETPMSFVGEREFYPNAMQDGFSENDDDHFFPLFLTAVIIVVVLYVLYHNKSKVSKVFLGLIVEGRQPGRRRNSRGHAYRRLDTLEQAMSANSAAPPSKIIY